MYTLIFAGPMLFLSTLSLRRATNSGNANLPGHRNFYPRSPCGERLYDTYAKVLRVNISIHALLAESDIRRMTALPFLSIFLSTLSLRRATIIPGAGNNPIRISIHALLAESDRRGAANCYLDNIISIHALLAESDHAPNQRPCHYNNFYPRSPCGERLILHMAHLMELLFLSTLSLRRATQFC